MSVRCWFYLQLISLGLVVTRTEECHRQLLHDCLRTLTEIAADPNLAFAVSDDMLSIVCRKVDDGMACAHNYTTFCYTRRQQDIHRQTMNGAIQVFSDLCTPGTFRQRFLKHAPCLRQASIGYDPCAHHYQQLLQYTDRQFRYGDQTDENLRKSCCSYSEFVACSTRKMAEDCGEEAAEFVAKFTRRAAGALIHRHCSEYLDGAQCSSRAFQWLGDPVMLLSTLILLSATVVYMQVS